MRLGKETLRTPNARRLQNRSPLPRLLKKVQTQGGARRTWSVRRSAARAPGYPPQVGHRRWAFFSSRLRFHPRRGLVIPVERRERQAARISLAEQRLADVPLDADLGRTDLHPVVDDVAQQNPAADDPAHASRR